MGRYLLGQSCPNPTYGRVLGSDAVGDLVTVGVTALGAIAGAAVAAATAPPAARAKYAAVGALAGGGIGFVGSLWPNLAARRAVLRGPGCPQASMGRLLAYSLAKYGVAAAVGVGARLVEPTAAPAITTAGTFFLAPFIGKEIIRA